MTACCVVTLFLAAWVAGAQPPAEDGATRVHDVFVKLQAPKTSQGTERWQLSEPDVNQFLAVAVASKKRIGLTKLQCEFDQSGALGATAVINMDEVKLDGLAIRTFKALLSGAHTLKAKGRLVIKNSKGVFEVDEASFDGMWVPAWFASSVVAFVGRQQPPHVDITEEFSMPYGISDVKISAKKAEIIR
jgi:hypothetical protein